jgi:hypothetical protein
MNSFAAADAFRDAPGATDYFFGPEAQNSFDKHISVPKMPECAVHMVKHNRHARNEACQPGKCARKVPVRMNNVGSSFFQLPRKDKDIDRIEIAGESEHPYGKAPGLQFIGKRPAVGDTPHFNAVPSLMQRQGENSDNTFEPTHIHVFDEINDANAFHGIAFPRSQKE